VQGNSEAAGFIGGPRDGLVNPHEDVRARLGVTEPGRRGSPADVFTAGRPLHHVLIPGCVVIAEIAEVIDIDREQVKVSWLGLPSESLRDRVRVTMLQAAVLLASGMTAYLEFPSAPLRLVTTLRTRMRGHGQGRRPWPTATASTATGHRP
jgi:hypothetical protein